MLIMGELRLETMGGNEEVSMMEGQDKHQGYVEFKLQLMGYQS
jgi:hypothetical protein